MSVLRRPSQIRRRSVKVSEDLKSSVGQFGICGVVLITPDGEIIDGHGVVATAESLGIDEVPCLVVGHLSRAEIRRPQVQHNSLP